MTASHRLIALVGVVPVVVLLLACGVPAGISQGPRWACPSPVPQPFGPDGPPKSKRRVCQVDPRTGEQICHTEYEYYEIWEQEYGPSGSLLDGQPAVANAPFPSPTPYGRQGNTYIFGQRVELAPLHVMVNARGGERHGNRQVFLITLAWSNPTGRPIPISYQRQLWLRSITRDDGTLLTGDGWNVDLQFASAQAVAIPDVIAAGESAITLPILAPPGKAKTVELRMPVVASTPAVGSRQELTPTPNAGLRARQEHDITVQWLDAQPIGPVCDDPGARTDWSQDDPKAIPRDAQVQLVAPDGTNRVVQLAFAQVGKRYVWGASGPDTFDCSGLMYWAYGQIGITIPRTTATQWPQLRPVAPAEWQAGDMVYMDTRTVREGFHGIPERITHVGMLADIDADGRWDLIHAASPTLGVRYELDVLHSHYYAPRLFAFGRSAR